VPLSGVSKRYTFAARPDDKTKKKRQYYAMHRTRGIWENGWKAVSVHAPISGKGNFDKDVWELYHVDMDRAEAHNLAHKYPERLKKLIRTWFEEARKNKVLPLDDRSALEILGTERPSEEKPRDRYVYYPHTSPVPEGVAVNVRGRNYKIIADVEVQDGCSGVIFAHGSRFGGHALFIKDMKLYYVYNFLGIKPEQQFISEPLEPGKYTLGMEFTREKGGPHGESLGTTKLYVNDKVVQEGPMKTQPGKFTLSGDGLCVGMDSGDAVSQEYKTPGEFTNGTILGVAVSVEKVQYKALEKLAAAAFATD
jgi:arylsulfatase